MTGGIWDAHHPQTGPSDGKIVDDLRKHGPNHPFLLHIGPSRHLKEANGGKGKPARHSLNFCKVIKHMLQK